MIVCMTRFLKMGKIKERIAPLDVNSNSEKEEEFLLHDLIDIGIKSGRFFFFGASYDVGPSRTGSGFVVRNHWKQKLFLRCLHAFFLLHLLIPFITEQVLLSSCCLVNMIKKGLHVILLFCMMASYYCVEIRGRDVAKGVAYIFNECVLLQSKFRALGIRFPNRAKARAIGWTVAVCTCIACVLRQYIFASRLQPWYPRIARHMSRTLTMGFWVADNSTVSEDVQWLFGSFGVVLDGMVANFWFFGQLIHFFFVVTMWLVFHKLNQAWESGQCDIRQLPEVIDLHFRSTKLLKAINQLIAPLTFWSLVFNIVIMCFWTNYIVVDFKAGSASKLTLFHVAAMCNFVKTAVEMYIEADVNSKAHLISEWLEEFCTSSDKFPPMDPVKLTIFTSQIYSKDSTGFRGLQFFVVTPGLAMTVIGIVITYSVAVHQFCQSY